MYGQSRLVPKLKINLRLDVCVCEGGGGGGGGGGGMPLVTDASSKRHGSRFSPP